MGKYGFLRFGKYMLFERENTQDFFEPVVDSHVRCLDATDKLVANTFDIDEEQMTLLLANGSKFFVYFEGQMPLGMMCGCSGSCYIRGPGIPLIQDDDTVYWFWIYTLPEARGKNVYTKLKQAFFSFYKNATLFTALVDPDNAIMCSEMQKMGFVSTKLYSYKKLFTVSLLAKKDLPSNLVAHSLEIGNHYNLLVI